LLGRTLTVTSSLSVTRLCVRVRVSHTIATSTKRDRTE
jgi:hypothetical protein